MEKLKEKARSLGASDLQYSNVGDKRFYVIYNSKKINFGSKKGQAFIDHKDEKKRDAWRARHSKIKNKKGELVYKLKTSSSFWSWHILW